MQNSQMRELKRCMVMKLQKITNSPSALMLTWRDLFAFKFIQKTKKKKNLMLLERVIIGNDL